MKKDGSRFLSLLLCLVVFQVMVVPDFAVAQALQRVPSIRSLPRCPVGTDPVDKDRQPAVDEEIVINPADQQIKYESGNGKSVDCVLQAGVPVVVNKETGIAKWVYGCGNDILSPWSPKRAPMPAITEQNTPPPSRDENVNLNVTGVPTDINVHVSGEVDVKHSGEVVFQPTEPLSNTFGVVKPPDKKSRCGTGCKILLGILIGGGIGGAALAFSGGREGGNQPTSNGGGGPAPFPRTQP